MWGIMKSKKDPIAAEISRQMRALSLRATPEQKSAAAKKAWLTRKRNIAARLGVKI